MARSGYRSPSVTISCFDGSDTARCPLAALYMYRQSFHEPTGDYSVDMQQTQRATRTTWEIDPAHTLIEFAAR